MTVLWHIMTDKYNKPCSCITVFVYVQQVKGFWWIKCLLSLFFFYIVALTISILFVLYFLKQTIRNLVRHTAAMHHLSLCSTLSFPLTDKWRATLIKPDIRNSTNTRDWSLFIFKHFKNNRWQPKGAQLLGGFLSSISRSYQCHVYKNIEVKMQTFSKHLQLLWEVDLYLWISW